MKNRKCNTLTLREREREKVCTLAATYSHTEMEDVKKNYAACAEEKDLYNTV